MTKTVIVGAHKLPAQKQDPALEEIERAFHIPRKKSLLSRCCDVIRDDIREKVFGVKIAVHDPGHEWEEYKRFCELARGEKH
jgi:hypothetical protein